VAFGLFCKKVQQREKKYDMPPTSEINYMICYFAFGCHLIEFKNKKLEDEYSAKD
jgi:hypothetical protein